MKTFKRTLGIALALAFSLNIALANTPAATISTAPDELAAAAVAAPSADTAAEAATAASTAAAPPKFGPGMQIPVDGTSLSAFEKSLADIKNKTTSPEYTTLTNAIDYLMVYSLEARRDRTKLAASLNGMTGEQIVGMVEWDR